MLYTPTLAYSKPSKLAHLTVDYSLYKVVPFIRFYFILLENVLTTSVTVL